MSIDREYNRDYEKPFDGDISIGIRQGDKQVHTVGKRKSGRRSGQEMGITRLASLTCCFHIDAWRKDTSKREESCALF